MNEISRLQLRSEIGEVYSEISYINQELSNRKSDTTLHKKIVDFWGEQRPDFIKDINQQYCYLSRPVISPNIETQYFLDISNIFALEPLLMEFPDKFVTRNNEKLAVAKVKSFLKDKPKVRKTRTLLNFQEWEGKPMSTIQTKSGESLIFLHHKLFLNKYPKLESNIIDISDWFKVSRSYFKNYYTGFLSLFIVNGVLLENFILDDDYERNFFIDKIYPSFCEIEEIFGIKPLIYPLLPLKDENNKKWLEYYEGDLTTSVGI